MMKRIVQLMLLAMVVVIHTNLYAQNLNVIGYVKDSNGEPLIGASVMVRGKAIGTTTDVKGYFELKNIAKESSLIASMLGMESVIVQASTAGPINITLKDNAFEIEEVSIGYGGVRKSDITGSLSSVKGGSFADQTITSPEEALMGRVAGVMIRSDKSPGGGISMQIRGSNSMLGGTEPLYVVDGFPIEPNSDAPGGDNTSASQSSLNFINPNDIESMEVLKDASATAIYGARGANGVVLITTKSGKSGATTVTYTGRFGFSEISKKIDLLNAEEYAEFHNQVAVNRAYVQLEAMKDPTLWPKQANLGQTYPNFTYASPGSYPWELGKGTDWQDAIYRSALSHSHSVQVQGGNDATKMSLSLGYTNSQGILLNSDFERFTVNNTIDHRLSRKFKVTNRINFSYGTGNSSSVGQNNVGVDRSIVSAALWTKPVFSLVKEVDESNPDLQIPIENGEYMTNPYLLATLVKDARQAYTLQDNLALEYKIDKYLTATGTAGYSLLTNERSQYWPISTTRGKRKSGVANLSGNLSQKIYLEFRFNYNRQFGKAHNLGLMLGTSMENTDYKDRFQEYSGFADDHQTYYNVSSATVLGVPQDSYNKTRLSSFFARGNYSYKNRYQLTATYRIDGSSRAAINKKYGFFPSFALAWRLSEEKFMKYTSGWLSNAKLRLFSFGVTGSQPGAAYRSLSTLTSSNVPIGGELGGAVFEGEAPNPNLTWERTIQYNSGIDLSFFKSRLNLTMDFYLKQTKDLLQNVNLPPSIGFKTVLMNLGEVQNKGFEFELEGTPIKNKKSTLSLSFNGSVNRNKLVSLGGGREYVTGVQQGNTEVNRFIIGYPLGAFWGYQVEGVFSDWNDVLSYPAQFDATPGEWKIRNTAVDYMKNQDGYYVLDSYGNRIVSPTQKINAEDKTVIGDPNPDFVFGFNAKYTYKNFDFGMLITGQLGGDIYWMDYQLLTNMLGTTKNVLRSAAENSWVAPTTVTRIDLDGFEYTMGNPNGRLNASFPRVFDHNVEPFNVGYGTARATYRDMNSMYILDGTHIKLQNISIGYTFKKLGVINSMRISFAADNIFTISNYPGYDPTLVASASPMRRGIDAGAYPAQRTYTFNLQMKF